MLKRKYICAGRRKMALHLLFSLDIIFFFNPNAKNRALEIHHESVCLKVHTIPNPLSQSTLAMASPPLPLFDVLSFKINSNKIENLREKKMNA